MTTITRLLTTLKKASIVYVVPSQPSSDLRGSIATRQCLIRLCNLCCCMCDTEPTLATRTHTWIEYVVGLGVHGISTTTAATNVAKCKLAEHHWKWVGLQVLLLHACMGRPRASSTHACRVGPVGQPARWLGPAGRARESARATAHADAGHASRARTIDWSPSMWTPSDT